LPNRSSTIDQACGEHRLGKSLYIYTGGIMSMSTEEYINSVMAQLFLQSRKQFGNAIKSFWFHDEDACPACGRKVDAMNHKGKDALSINAFIYRKRGVLIGYLLCGRCATKLHREAQRNPGQQTSQHATIEENLANAYLKHMNSMDA